MSHLSLDVRYSKSSHPWAETTPSSGLTAMAVSPSALEHFAAVWQELFWNHLVRFMFQPWAEPFLQDVWFELLVLRD